ncbi:cell division protein ZapE [Pseudomonas sp. RIT-PI-S]|uniref:cell division protein ZapE n=1 Tax=Pseudomonas sp. RIT-PI-S TaxID=3035295 RepID=UPI0021D96118|nr:cell division protein ZapE [Pseudomonas sp. RIT-PI-S]
MKRRSPGNELVAAIEQAAQAKGYRLDTYQAAATERLGELAQGLLSPSLLMQLGYGTPRSLYLWGPVGRGKSFLLDTFFAAIPLQQKRRVHFHAFFRELHQRMFDHAATHDAMGAALDSLLGNCRLLCFDEFHLHDIGDAMLISRLFKALFKRHCVLVVTSNYPPQGLLPNPLYHERFLPTIELIEQHMDIQSIAGDVDYRTSTNASADAFNQGAFICPGNAEQRRSLGLPPGAVATEAITVNHRALTGLVLDETTVYFTFAQLCEAASATMDYLALVDRYDCWILDAVPRLSSASPAGQQRFLNLIDVLYDRRCTLFLISEVEFSQMMDACEAGDLARTRSRVSQLRWTLPTLQKATH